MRLVDPHAEPPKPPGPLKLLWRRFTRCLARIKKPKSPHAGIIFRPVYDQQGQRDIARFGGSR